VTAEDAARALLEKVAGAPDGLWSAPGRVNLIGEHTDYNDGFVLPFATPFRTYAAYRMRDDRTIRVASTFADDVVELPLDALAETFPDDRERVPEWARYPLGVAWALTRESGTGGLRGVDLAIASDVPVGAGLSSSAAIENAVAGALDEAWGLGRERVALALAGRTAENEAVGAPTGIMDQFSSMLGVADAALFLDCRTLEARPVELGFADAGLSLLVMDTRVSHAHSTGGYADRRAACERGAAALGVPALRDATVEDLARAEELLDPVTFRRVRHVVTEDQRVLDTVRALSDEGPAAVGELLTASHRSMRDDFEISTPELDTAVDAAIAAGALGARMTGGGFGGAAIALVPDAQATAIAAAVTSAFATAGFRPPHIFSVTPSSGAHAG
jgi:galactokinase